MKRKPVAVRKRRRAAGRSALRRGTADVLSDPGLMHQIERSRAFYEARGKGLSFEDVFEEPLRPIRKTSARR